jgi:AcrR family transcriptional regulator
VVVRRSGRRPGNQDTREVILAAARDAFAERGYDGASIRHIATGAGVDPALVHHYFGTKDQLFLAAMRAPVDPAEILPQVFAGDRDQIGERLVRTLLRVWDSPAGGPAAALIRSAVSNEAMARMLREFIINRILRRAVKELDLDPAEAPLRANLVATQIAGIVMIRYILKVEPLASAAPDTLAAAIGPTIQRYITGDLGLSPPTSGAG